MVTIYDEQGAGGLAVFLSDSGLLDKLGVPASYLDFLRVYDDGGMQAVSDLAHQRHVVNHKDELLAWIAIDDKANLAAMTDSLQGLGVSVYDYMENTREVEVGIPLDILAQYQSPGGLLGYLVAVVNVPHAVGVRPPVPDLTDGLTLQQAIVAAGADRVGAGPWHDQGITGKGVRIGIIDLGFGGIDQYIGNELPADVHSNEPIATLATNPEDHGAAVAIVAHRAAPDAELYLADASGGYSKWLDALQYMADNQVQIINYSAGLDIGPMDGTWGRSVEVDNYTRQFGALWTVSAGNEADIHTMFQFNPGDKGFHVFGTPTPDNVGLPFTPLTDTTDIFVNWDGNWKGGETDNYYVLVADESGNVVATAEEPRTGGPNDLPYQILEANLTPGNLYFVLFQQAPGTTARHTFNVFVMDSQLVDWALMPDHSIDVPADAASVLTVGATKLISDDLEFFSSQGPTLGNQIKPDVTAPDREPVPQYNDPSGFTGTSASAPLTAGIAALVLQVHPDFTAAQLKAYLMSNVVDLGDPGADNVFGAGRLALPAPNAAVSAPTPAPVGGTISAKVYNYGSQFGVTENGESGVLVSVSFGVENAAGHKIVVAVTAHDANGGPISSPDSNYAIGNTVGTAQVFDVTDANGSFSGVTLFLPDHTLSWVTPGTQMALITGIYDVTDQANAAVLWEGDPVLITISN